jgi:CheY-like chemotaxis protein
MSAEEAPEAIRDEKPQVILLDMGLAGTDGLQFARALKADALTSDIRVIAVTSFPEKYSRAAAVEAGCDAYILKPINTRTLSAEIIEVFNCPHEI